jgi:rare lipoprotein A
MIMRYIALATLALLTVGTFDARTASAATWQCVGPEVACDSASAAPKASYKKQRAAAAHKGSRSARQAIKHSNKVAKKASGSYSAASYSGGTGGGSGMASYYWQGQQTASGARFNPNGLTAAHRTLPFGTRVLVTNHSNGRTVTVTINDRGPFIKGRVIDLSRGAASVIGMTGQGVARVSYTVVGRG